MLTEFGGVSYTENGPATTRGATPRPRVRKTWWTGCAPWCDAVRKSAPLAGYCYTQLADTGQETNGLVFEDRRPKAPIEELRAIFGA